MSSQIMFPPLTDWQATKQTMHLYSNVIGVVPRVYAEAHPRWWHISLKMRPDGLVTDEMPLPGGGTFYLKMDLRRHQIVLSTGRGDERQFSMTAGLTATAMGDQVLAAVAELGLKGDYARQKFESDEPRRYDPAKAETFLTVLLSVHQIFEKHRATLSGEVGPIQVWPHGFDMAFEWFGTRQIEHEEHGQVQKSPAQLNCGFSPGEPHHPEPYFYSNPWPFEADELLAHPLPSGARWFTEGWQGSLLEYDPLAGDPQAGDKLFAYIQAVYKIASPTLMA